MPSDHASGGSTQVQEQAPGVAGGLPSVRILLYPRLYPWYALMALLDVLVTAVVLEVGGYEANGLAARILEFAGILGLLAFKLASVVLVISICEVVGRRKETTARRLAEWAVAITAIPVAVGLVQLAWFAHVLDMSVLVGMVD